MLRKSLAAAHEESLILQELAEFSCAPTFHEIHFEGKAVWCLTETLEGEHFSEWFGRYILKDSHEDKLILPVLKLIRELLDLVRLLTVARISHNGITKERIVVHACKCFRCTGKNGTNVMLEMVSAVSQVPQSKSVPSAFLESPRNKSELGVPQQQDRVNAYETGTVEEIVVAQPMSDRFKQTGRTSRQHKSWRLKLTGFWSTQRHGADKFEKALHRGQDVGHTKFEGRSSKNPKSILIGTNDRPKKGPFPESEDIFSVGQIIYEM